MNQRKYVSRGLIEFYGGGTKKLYTPIKRTRRQKRNPANGITCKQFMDLLVSQEPVYGREAIRDIRPTDGLIGYYPDTDPVEQSAYEYFNKLLPSCVKLATPKPIEFAVNQDRSHSFDDFKDMFPRVTAKWKE